MINRVGLLTAASLAAMTLCSYSASADSSCDELLTNLSNKAGLISFLWTTHFRTDNGAGNVGFTLGNIEKPDSSHIIGKGNRLWFDRFRDVCPPDYCPARCGGATGGFNPCNAIQPFNIESPEAVTFEITRSEPVSIGTRPPVYVSARILIGTLGSFEIKCEGNKFLNANTGDTFETITFNAPVSPPH